MTKTTEIGGARRWSWWRATGWGTAAALLLVPLVAKWPWTLSDFIFMGALFCAVGLAFEAAVRLTRNNAYRAAAGVALLTIFLTIWINAAVGMIGDEDNPLNLMFAGVIGVALLGAVVARFRPGGMARAMAIAGGAQALVGIVGMSTDLRGGILSAMFALLWLLSAGLFIGAAREKASAGEAS